MWCFGRGNINTRGSWRNRCLKINCLLRDTGSVRSLTRSSKSAAPLTLSLRRIQTLQKTPAVNTRTHHAKTEFVTNATIEKIIKLLRCAFKQAVRWELVAKNPFDNVVLPKVEYKKRDIWTADMIRTALDQCTDSKLYVASPA